MRIYVPVLTIATLAVYICVRLSLSNNSGKQADVTFVQFVNASGPAHSMIFWLKYLGRYGVSEINIIPVGQSLFAVVMSE